MQLWRHTDVTVPRAVRKAIFSLRLWRPARQRLHSQRTLRPARPSRTKSADRKDVVVGCVNAQSLGNKAPTLCRSVIDEQLDIVMSYMRVCRKQALSRVKYYNYVTNSKIQQATIMTVIMTK